MNAAQTNEEPAKSWLQSWLQADDGRVACIATNGSCDDIGFVVHFSNADGGGEVRHILRPGKSSAILQHCHHLAIRHSKHVRLIPHGHTRVYAGHGS